MAWQILMRVVQGKELMPVWARHYASESIQLAMQRLAEEAEVGDAGAGGPGSASPADPASEEPLLKKHNRRQRRCRQPTAQPCL